MYSLPPTGQQPADEDDSTGQERIFRSRTGNGHMLERNLIHIGLSTVELPFQIPQTSQVQLGNLSPLDEKEDDRLPDFCRSGL